MPTLVQRDKRKIPVADLKRRLRGVRSLSTGTSLAVQEKIPFQDSKGKSHSLTLSRTANVDTNRLGRAVTNFAKKVGPLAVGFAIADAVCDLTDICSIDDVWQKTADPDLVGYPQSTDFISYYVPSFSPLFPTQDLVCAFAADFYGIPVTYTGQSGLNCPNNLEQIIIIPTSL